MKIDRKCLASGVMAGFLAGAVLIVFYFFYDLIRSEPLATPTFMAGALLGHEGLEPTSLHIALFTLLHFVAFIALGVLASVVIELTEAPRTVLFGVAYGLFAYSLVFYSALVMSSARILDAPAWPIVFFGNVVAGAVMLGYLRWTSRDEGVTGLASSVLGSQVIREGIAVGAIGAGTVAMWFLVLDMVVGRPLYTPGALGSAMLYGAAAADAVVISPGTVLGYTLYHIAAFTTVGILASVLVRQAVKFPPLVFGLIILLVVFETAVVFLVAMLGAWLMHELAWWALIGGNLLATISMGSYLLRRHPQLRYTLREDVLWAEP